MERGNWGLDIGPFDCPFRLDTLVSVRRVLIFKWMPRFSTHLGRRTKESQDKCPPITENSTVEMLADPFCYNNNNKKCDIFDTVTGSCHNSPQKRADNWDSTFGCIFSFSQSEILWGQTKFCKYPGLVSEDDNIINIMTAYRWDRERSLDNWECHRYIKG